MLNGTDITSSQVDRLWKFITGEDFEKINTEMMNSYTQYKLGISLDEI